MNITGLYLRRDIKTGAHRRYLELLSQLAERGHKITLIMQNPVLITTPHITTIEIKGFAKNGKKTLTDFISILLEKKIIQTQCPSTNLILVFGEISIYPAKLLSIFLHAPVVLSIRSNFYEAYSQYMYYFQTSNYLQKTLRRIRLFYLGFLEKSVLLFSHRIVVQTSVDAGNIMRRNPCFRKKLHVVPNSMNASWFSSQLKNRNQSNKCRKIVFIGSIGTRKGFSFLFTAVRNLIHKGYHIELNVLGAGKTQTSYEKELAKDQQLAQRVIFHGHIDNVLEKLFKYDLLVVPSIYDSFPNVIFEALFTGTPVIGSATGGITKMLNNDKLLFSPGSTQQIEEIIEKCYVDNNYYLHLKKLCKDRQAEFNFDWAERFSSALQISEH